MDYIVVANDTEHVKRLHEIGIENIVVSSKYSSYRQEFTMDSIKLCYEITNNLYVSIYDLISESIIEDVIAYVDELVLLGIKNFIVNDIGIIYYLKNKGCKVIYDNITLNTNYETLNILYENGIDSCVLGREITLEELNEISEKTKMNTVVHVQGMFPIFSSIRKLVTNYFDAKSIDKHKDSLALFQKDRDATYPIIETDNGVIMFTSYEQCSIEEIAFLKSTTLLIDQPFVDNDISIEIVKMYLDYEKYSISDIKNISKYKQSKGFFFKKTMYKL